MAGRQINGYRSLQDEGLARYDHVRYVVWVRIWWDHHTTTQVTGPKLRTRALEEIRRIPSEWLDDFLRDFKERLTVDQQRWINEALRPPSDPGLEEISIPYRTMFGITLNLNLNH